MYLHFYKGRCQRKSAFVALENQKGMKEKYIILIYSFFGEVMMENRSAIPCEALAFSA